MKKLILFVHGLGGAGKATWQSKNSPTGFPDLIQKDLELSEQYDVAFYQYPTSLIRLPFFTKFPTVQALAEGLRTQINNRYREYESIVLVCHSLGGLIARMYLIEEVQERRPLRVKKLLLYAVPNNGARIAAFGNRFSWRHNQLAQLSEGSDLLDFLNKAWFRLGVGDGLDIK